MEKTISLQSVSVHPREGLTKTLSILFELEKLSLQSPLFVTWIHANFSNSCLPCIPGKIWKHVRDNFSYVPDDPFDEILIAPYLMKDLREGDCDDFSLFIKTALDILGGFNTYYMLLGKEKNKFSHICVYANRGMHGSVAIDPVIIDGTNSEFNTIPSKYKSYRLV